MRTRTCNNPLPAHGGDICLGLHTEEALCHTQLCPGTHTHTLKKHNNWCFFPSVFEQDHVHPRLNVTFPCVVVLLTESWSSWSEWSQCDSSGSQLRVRHCDVLFPTGNQCSGNNTENRPCPPDSNFIPGINSHTYIQSATDLNTHVTHSRSTTHTHTHTVVDPHAHSHSPILFAPDKDIPH